MKGIIGDAFIIGFVVTLLLTITAPLWYSVLVRYVNRFKSEMERLRKEREYTHDAKLRQRAYELYRCANFTSWHTPEQREREIERIYRKLKNG